MDKNYCIIKVTNKYITLYIYMRLKNKDREKELYKYPLCLYSNRADKIYKMLLVIQSVQSLCTDHLLYIGKELYKAELAYYMNQHYIQE